MAESLQSRRRWFRFSLRTFLIVVTVLTVMMGLWVNNARRQRIAVEKLRSIPGNRISYAHQDHALGTFDDNSNKTTHSWVPNFLYHSMGPDYFHNVIAVQIHSGIGWKEPSLRICKDLIHLKRLNLIPYVEGDDRIILDLVCELPTLEELAIDIPFRWLTVERLNRLADLKQLKDLSMTFESKFNYVELAVLSPKKPVETFNLSGLRKLNQIEKITLSCASGLDWDFTDDFFDKEMKLKEITIMNSQLGDYVTSQFEKMVEALPNLELISVEVSEKVSSFAPLKKLKNLKSISLQTFLYGSERDQLLLRIQNEVPNIRVQESYPRGSK